MGRPSSIPGKRYISRYKLAKEFNRFKQTFRVLQPNVSLPKKEAKKNPIALRGPRGLPFKMTAILICCTCQDKKDGGGGSSVRVEKRRTRTRPNSTLDNPAHVSRAALAEVQKVAPPSSYPRLLRAACNP